MRIRIKERNTAITDPGAVCGILSFALKSGDPIDRDKEHFWVVGLTTRNTVKYVDLVSLGTLNSSLVHPREVFRLSIIRAASSLVLAHNHPSGDPAPSPEDLRITSRLVEAGRIIGIEILDHVIIVQGGYRSLKEAGFM